MTRPPIRVPYVWHRRQLALQSAQCRHAPRCPYCLQHHVCCVPPVLPVPQDMVPYVPLLMPELQKAVVDPLPEVRAMSARAMGSLMQVRCAHVTLIETIARRCAHGDGGHLVAELEMLRTVLLRSLLSWCGCRCGCCQLARYGTQLWWLVMQRAAWMRCGTLRLVYRLQHHHTHTRKEFSTPLPFLASAVVTS